LIVRPLFGSERTLRFDGAEARQEGLKMLDERLNRPWWALRLSYGLVPIIAGLDKFTNLLTDWKHYLNPLAERVLPFSGSTFMRLVGVIEIVAGVLVLTKFTRLGAYIVSAWLLAIALNLITGGRYLDVAVRDLVMSVGAFVFARMTAVREGVAARSASRRGLEPSHVGV
jgi:uncharacterized membrane protein YphA (DoxX/SURF4 family)